MADKHKGGFSIKRKSGIAEQIKQKQMELKELQEQQQPSQAKPSQAKPSQPSQAKPSQPKPSQAKPSQAKPSQASPTKKPKVDRYAKRAPLTSKEHAFLSDLWYNKSGYAGRDVLYQQMQRIYEKENTPMNERISRRRMYMFLEAQCRNRTH